MARRKFRLLKDTADLKAGFVIEEKCDDGTQNFVGVDINFVKYPSYYKDPKFTFYRKEVLGQPDWFEEIESVSVPKKLVLKVKAYIKKLK